MRLLGLPAPRSLFESAGSTIATTSAISKAITQYASKVTLQEILFTMPTTVISAPALAEFATVSAAVSGAFYVGACIGSFAYAVGQTISSSHYAGVLARMRLAPRPWMTPALAQVAARRGRRP